MENLELMFHGDAIVTASAADGPPQFSMCAYTGSVVELSGWPEPVIVDFAGLSIPAQKIPIRKDHLNSQGVGHSTRISVENGSLVAEGLISRDTVYARDIAKSGRSGFPWQASIGGPATNVEFLRDGETATVNGRLVAGPLNIVRGMVLREISFVEYGADGNTSATVQAISIRSGKMDENTEVVHGEVRNEERQQPEGGPMSEAVIGFRHEVTDELKRVAAIRAIGRGADVNLEILAIEEGWTPERFELESLRAARPSVPAVHAVNLSATPEVLEVVALAAAGVPMSNIERRYGEQTLDLSDKYRGIGFQEFCELACSRQLPRFRRDAGGWLNAAFSTAALPGILSNVANKMLLDGYNYVEDAWRRICKISSVNDFKLHRRYRMTGAFRFEPVGPQGELQHGAIGEQLFSQQADTHGIMFAFTRKMIIDDDMGAFLDMPRQIGMGAAEAIADAVWSLLLSNPPQPDSKAFFHADHGNLLAGAATALSVSSLTDAEILFGSQTKPIVGNQKKSRPLGVMPTMLLVPIALKVIAELLMKSTQLNETTPEGLAKPSSNPHAGKYEVVSSTYLSNGSFAGASSKAWYLLADPNRLPSLEVAFLGGVDRPTIERADADFNTLGIQFRGYIDFGVKEQDHRGMLKVKGEV